MKTRPSRQKPRLAHKTPMTNKYHAIWGPPGTGKSTHLSALVKELAATTPNMAVVSFTKAAAGVLASRVPSHSVRYVGTLHALAFKVLGLTKAQIADDKKFTEWYGYTDQEEVVSSLSVANYGYHFNCPLPEAFAATNPAIPFMRLEHMILSYENWINTYQYVTFNKMIELATDGFSNGEFEKFDVVVVDEAQDLTNRQWAMVTSMVSKGGSVYMGGDDDQAVYTWAGANPHAMVELTTTSEVLGQSYRIPLSVHTLAEKVVRRISKRAEKEYKPRDFMGKVEFATLYEPLMYNSPHTVLCRDKWVMKDVEEQLLHHAIPYTSAAHTAPYDKPRARLIRAMLSEDLATTKKLSKYLHKEFQEDVGKAVSIGWKKSINFGTNEIEARYLSLLDHDAEPLVHLSTIHGAKGEEDNHVVLMAQCSGRVECAMDSTTTYDDEIRVWYVGITRAKECLTVIGSNQYIQ